MNLKTTFMLLLLAGAGTLLWWYGHLPLPPTLDFAPQPAVPEEKGTRAFLNALQPDKIQRLEIHAPSGLTEFTRKADGQWGLPGNWPVRRREVERLVSLLTSLRSRFQPQPIQEEKDLQAFGLDRPPVTVTIRTEDEEHTLAFGEPPADNLENRFSRDTYARLDRKKEVVRLAPGLIAALDKPTDYYQERRLFEKETIRSEDGSEVVEQLQARSLTVEDKKSDGIRFTVVRSGKSWKEAELAEPVRDRLDEEARKALLDGVLDLWAEQFVPTGGGLSPWLWHAPVCAGAASLALDLFFATQGGLLVRAGLTNPERIITTKNDKGDTVTLFIGSVSSRRQRLASAPQTPGMFPAMQQRTTTVTEEYRYAKLQYNDQIFEIRTDKFKDIFVALDKLRDSRIVRFNSADARRVEITHDSQEIVLEKDKDNWKLLNPFRAEAENSKVTDLLTKLSDLQARDKDILDKEDPKKYGFDKPQAVVKVSVEESAQKEGRRRLGGPAEKKMRTLTVRIGKRDTDKKKLYVMADDWPRINIVDDSLASLVQCSALAYRSKRLFDFSAAEVAKIDINNQDKRLTLERSQPEQSESGTVWQLVHPVKAEADAAKVDQLLADLGRLEAVEFLTEEPKQEELETRYGLGKPPLIVRIEFTDKKKPAKEMHLGKARSSKGGYFARLAEGGPVFTINEEVHKLLIRDALSYRPQTLWQLLPEEIETVHVHKAGQKEYTLTRSENKWKISGPFEADAQGESVQKMTTELLMPKVESYTAHEAKDLAKYGLDKPMLTVRIKPVLAKSSNEHTLLIGKPVKEGGSYYAKRGHDTAIFTLSNALVHAIDRDALDLLDTKLLTLDAAKIEWVHSQTADKSWTLKRTQAERGKEKIGWQVTDSPAGTYPADAQATASLSSTWSDLRAQRFADYGQEVEWAKYGLDKPVIRITLSERSDASGAKEHIIELGKQVEGEKEARYARVDKGMGVAVLSPETTRVLTRSYLDYVTHQLLKFDSTTAVSLQRRIGTNVLEIVKQDTSWNIVQPVQAKADDPVMQQMFEQLGNLRAERIAAYPVKELQPFGLDSPSALVTIQLKGVPKPSEHVIKLGQSADKSGARFALVDNSNAVAVLPASLSAQLMGTPLAFRDRTIVRFADADRLQLDRGPRHAVFSKVEGSWKLTQPLQAEAEQDLLEDFVGRLKHLRAEELVAEKPDADTLKKYGLDHPEVQWRVQAGDKEVLNLLIGGPERKEIGRPQADSTRRYAKLAQGEWVFLLDPRLSQKVLEEYRPRTVWTPPLDSVDIESLNYRYHRTSFTLEKRSRTQAGSNGTAWQVVDRPEAKIHTATVEDTLAALAGLKLSRYVVDKDAHLALFGLDKPELILEIATRSGKRVLHVGNVEARSKGRYARVLDRDRSDVFVLDEETCARILRDLSAFSRPPAQSNVSPAAH